MQTTPVEILKKYWGYDSFRTPQLQVIESVLNRKDCLALLPTGGGKSVCFQVPAMLMDGICLVVSPLIALMEDQIRQLKSRGISCAVIHSGMGYDQIDATLDNCIYGQVKFLYLSPERIQTELFQVRLSKMKVSMVAVDEAHCISAWGYDFRPPYLQIGRIREIHPDIPILALTASATEKVCADIMDKLGLKNPVVHRKSFARDNISFVVRSCEHKEKQLLDILRRVPGCAIVYVRSRKATADISALLNRNKITSTFYHAGLTYTERNKRQATWISNEMRVMVATNAFGMGIDKPDVRVVIHMDIPESLEAYYQEAGRAGRDGKKSFAVLLQHPSDTADLEHKTLMDQPSVDYLRKIYQCLANYYQLAEGAGEGFSVDFDLFEFCNRFSLKLSTAHAAIKRLEESGLIFLDERFSKPSRLHIGTDRKKLYEFQVANEKFDPLIHVLLRLYGAALFSDYVLITESAIAITLKITAEEVKALLIQLGKLQVLHYDPASNHPRLTWLTPRLDASRLPLDLKKLELRKTTILEKLKAIINYVKTPEGCRQQIMLDYFNEPAAEPCGKCDLCLSRQKSSNKQSWDRIRTQILKSCNDKAIPLDELEEKVSFEDRKLFPSVIRELLEENILTYDAHWMIRKAGKDKS